MNVCDKSSLTKLFGAGVLNEFRANSQIEFCSSLQFLTGLMECINRKVLQAVHNSYYCTHIIQLNSNSYNGLHSLTEERMSLHVDPECSLLSFSLIFMIVPWCLFFVPAPDSQLNRCGTQLTVPRHFRRGYHWVGKRIHRYITRSKTHIISS